MRSPARLLAASREHPTAKPVELIRRLVSNSSRGGQIVLDCFGGSGSTLIACEELSRRVFLMELDPADCDVIIEQFEALTRQEARFCDRRRRRADLAWGARRPSHTLAEKSIRQ